MKRILLTLLAVSMFVAISTPAFASLSVFQTYTGNVGFSSDGCGSTTQTCTIRADVPVGATVLGAFLYTSTFDNPTISGVNGTTLNGNALTPFTNLGVNAASCCALAAGETDVTSIVAPIINGGPGGIYNFTVNETDASQDGEGLVVVYKLASLPTSTVAILQGFSSSSGDTATLNLGQATTASSSAQMIIGDGFSCCDQASTITVNGTVITNEAGNNDDGAQVANGSLITVGGIGDPELTTLLPTYANDHENYNLAADGSVAVGSTSITVRTVNPSNDDNIFLEVFDVSGTAVVTTTPEPGSLMLLGVGLIGLAIAGRRKFQLQK